MIIKTKTLKKHGMSVKEIAGILGVREKLVRRDDVGYCPDCDRCLYLSVSFQKTDKGNWRDKCIDCLNRAHAKIIQRRRMKRWMNRGIIIQEMKCDICKKQRYQLEANRKDHRWECLKCKEKYETVEERNGTMRIKSPLRPKKGGIIISNGKESSVD